MDVWKILFDIVFLLLGCVALGGLATRIGQSPIVGYLLAGMLLGGPGSLYFVGSQHEIEVIAELGVSLLLFSIGLEFSWHRLKKLGALVLIGGSLQIGVTVFVFTLLLLLIGTSVDTAIAFGVVIAASSTACVLRVLHDRGEIDSAHGRTSVGVLLVQDLAIVPLALVLTLLGSQNGGGDVLSQLWTTLLLIVGLAVGLYLFVNIVAVRLLAPFAIERNRELAILFGIALGLGSTWLAHEAKLSPALGAFLAGMFLGSSPFATQIRADISPLKVLLLTLFFGAAGMVADPRWMVLHFGQVLAATTGVMLVKTVILAVILWSLRRPLSTALSTGITLSQVGEFSFVLGITAFETGLFSEHAHLLTVSVAILSLFATPLLIHYAPLLGMRIAEWTGLGAIDTSDSVEEGIFPEMVVIGFGPSGEAVAAAHCDFGRQLLVIDLNQAAKARAQKSGYSVMIGDAALLEVMEHAHLENVKLVVVTIPHPESAQRAISHIRAISPNAQIVARARFHLEANRLEAAGAHVVISDEEQVGSALALEVAHLRRITRDIP
ncbi:MAG: cation:proton antiporter [Bdellovibrionales bacterium]|nr:cation:proton antiporter [Bdellovibrionales bacterium]